MSDFLEDYGLTPEYFQNFTFLNEVNSITYCIITAGLFVYFGGIKPLIFAAIGALCLSFFLHKFIINPRQKIVPGLAVVITGCSSGIGKDTALFLAEHGFTVFATVRKQSDGDALVDAFNEYVKQQNDSRKKLSAELQHQALTAKLPSAKIIPVILEVASQDSIVKCVETISTLCNQQQLYIISLINNAGYAQSGQMELLTSNQIQQQFETNVFGLLTFSRHMLPLLRSTVQHLALHQQSNSTLKTKLRPSIINVASLIAFVTAPTLGLYAASKSALLSLSSHLRLEVQKMGINVVAVCPGATQSRFLQALHSHQVIPTTRTTTTTSDAVDETLTQVAVVERYLDLHCNVEHHIQHWYYTWGLKQLHIIETFAQMFNFSTNYFQQTCLDIIVSPRPYSYYLVGPDSNIVYSFLRWVKPSGLFDLFTLLTIPSVPAATADH